MDRELKAGLLEIVKKINEGIDAGADFAIEQTPLVVQEFIVRERILSTVWFVVGVAMMLAAYPTARYWWRKYDGWWVGDPLRSENLPLLQAATVVSVIVSFGVGAVLAGGNLSPMVTAWFAPRVLILEKLASLIK